MISTRRYPSWAFIFTSACTAVACFLRAARLTFYSSSHSCSRHSGPRPGDGAQHHGMHDGDFHLHHLLRNVQDIHISLPRYVPSTHTSSRLSLRRRTPAEKVYAVWATGPVKRRMHCKLYLACLALVSCYIGVAVVMILGTCMPLVTVEAFVDPRSRHGSERIALSDDRGTCYIGLRRVSSVLLLSYDLYVCSPSLLPRPSVLTPITSLDL